MSITAEPQPSVAPRTPPLFPEQWIVQYQSWLQHGVNKWAALVMDFRNEADADAFIAKHPDRKCRKVYIPAEPTPPPP